MDSNIAPEVLAPEQAGPPATRLQNAYDLLRSQDVKVPDTYDEFERGVVDQPERLQKLYDYFKSKDIQVPDDFGQFSSGMLEGVAKKKVPSEPSSPPAGAGAATDKPFVTADPDTLPPTPDVAMAAEEEGLRLKDSAGAIDTASLRPGVQLAPGDEYAAAQAPLPTGDALREQTEKNAMAKLSGLPGSVQADVRPVDEHHNAIGHELPPLAYGKERVVIPKEHDAQVPENTVTDPKTGLRYFDRPLSRKVDGKEQSVYESAKALAMSGVVAMAQGGVEALGAVNSVIGLDYDTHNDPYGSTEKVSQALEGQKPEASDFAKRQPFSIEHPETWAFKSAEYAPLVVAQVAQTLAPELRLPEAVTAAVGMVSTGAFDAQIMHGAAENAKKAGLKGRNAALYTIFEGTLTLAGFKAGSKLMGALGDKLGMKIAPDAAREAIALDAARGVAALEAKLGRAATQGEIQTVLSGSLRKSMPGLMQIPKEMFQQAPVFGGVEAVKMAVNQTAAPALGGKADQLTAGEALGRIGGGMEAGMGMGAITGGLGAVLGTGSLPAGEEHPATEEAARPAEEAAPIEPVTPVEVPEAVAQQPAPAQPGVVDVTDQAPEAIPAEAPAAPMSEHSAVFDAFAKGISSANEKELLTQLQSTGRVYPRQRHPNETNAAWQQAVADRQPVAGQMERLTGKKFVVMSGKDANGVDAVFVAEAPAHESEPSTNNGQPAESGQQPSTPPSLAEQNQAAKARFTTALEKFRAASKKGGNMAQSSVVGLPAFNTEQVAALKEMVGSIVEMGTVKAKAILAKMREHGLTADALSDKDALDFIEATKRAKQAPELLSDKDARLLYEVSKKEAYTAETAPAVAPIGGNFMLGNETVQSQTPNFFSFTGPRKTYDFNLVVTKTEGGQTRYLGTYDDGEPAAGLLFDKDGDLVTARNDTGKTGLTSALLRAAKKDLGTFGVKGPTSQQGYGFVRKFIVREALNEGKYQKAVADGKITVAQAREIIEGAGLPVPSDLADTKPAPTRKPLATEEAAAKARLSAGFDAFKRATKKGSGMAQSSVLGIPSFSREQSEALLEMAHAAIDLGAVKTKQVVARLRAMGLTADDATDEQLRPLVKQALTERNLKTAKPRVEPPAAAVDAIEELPGTKDRKSMARALADPEQPESVKQAIRDTALDKYTPTSHAATQATVDDYMKRNTLQDAFETATLHADEMDGAVRTALRIRVQREYNTLLDKAVESGDTAAADEYLKKSLAVAKSLAERGTEAGKEIDAFKELVRHSPDAAVYQTSKDVEKAAETKRKKATPKLKKEAAAIQQAKKDAADAALAHPKVAEAAAAVTEWAVSGKKPAGKPAAPKPNTTPPDAPAWGSKNKVFTKESAAKAREALRKMGLSTVIPPELVHFVGFHMEAGARSFADVSKRVLRDLGQKVKPLLAEAYEKAKAEMIAKGDSGQGFDGKDAVAAALNKELAEDLAERIVSAAKPKVPGVFDPVRDLLDTLAKKVSETLDPAKPTPRPAREALAAALNDRANYADVFEQSKKLVEAKIDALKISDAAKQKMRDDLADYHAEIIGKPFADQQFARAYREAETEALKAYPGRNRGEQLDKLATASDADIFQARQQLVGHVVEGVTDQQAKAELANYTGQHFDQRIAERQQALRLKNKVGHVQPVTHDDEQAAGPDAPKAKPAKPALPERVRELLATRATDERVAGRVSGDAVREGVSKLKSTLDQIARDHLSDPTETGRSLAEAFEREAGLTPAQAKHYAKVIEQEFATQIAKSREKQLNQKYSQLVKIKGEKAAKDWLAKAQELFTLSPASDERIQGLLAETLDLPSLSVADVANLRALAKKVQEAKGETAKTEAVYNLMLAQKNIKGITPYEGVKAFFYAHLLTGLFTHAKNFAFTGFNGALQLVNETGYAGYLAAGHAVRTRSLAPLKLIATPFRGIGRSLGSSFDQAYKVLATGVEPLDVNDKYGTPNDLEALRRKFPDSSNADLRALQLGLQKYAAFASYAGRFLKANDVLFQVNFANMRAFNLALADAMAEGKTLPTEQIWGNAMDKLYNTSVRLEDAQAQARAEIPGAGKSKNPLALDNVRFRMRVRELMEESRDAEIAKEAKEGAARDAFNGPLEGMLGDATAKLQGLTDVEGPGGVQPLKTQIPFTKIISNQVNASLDYIPLVGGYRAIRGKIGHQGNAFERQYSGKERVETGMRALAGTALLYAVGTSLLGPKRLSGSGPDDQEKKKALKAAGWMESSYNFGTEEKPNWWSYKNTKFNLILSAIANVREGEEYNGADYANDPVAIKRLGAVTFGVLQGMKNTTGFQNLSDMLTAVGNVGDGTADERFMRWIQRQVGSIAATLLTPGGNLTTQVSKLAQRQMDVPRRDAQTVGQVATQNVDWNSAPLAYDDLGYPQRIDNDVFHSTQPDWHDEDEQNIRAFQAKYGSKLSAAFVPDAQRMNNDMAVLRLNPTAPVLSAEDHVKMDRMTDGERKAFMQKRGDLEGPMGQQMFADFKLKRAVRIREGYADLLAAGLEKTLEENPRQAERMLKNLYRTATKRAKLEVLNGDYGRMNYAEQAEGQASESSGSGED